MKILVEVGTTEQVKMIESELRLIEVISERLEPPLNISSVYVPNDFDKKVNELQRTDNYKSVRGVMAIAKKLEVEGGAALVFSPVIYTESWDVQMRTYVYLHELYHVWNKTQIIKPETQSHSLSVYYEDLYRLYDEYAADRLALWLIDKLFPELSDKMQTYIESYISGFIDLINDSQYYEQIKKEIESFRIHRDVDKYFTNIHDSFSEVAMAISHLYAFADNYSKYKSKIDTSFNSMFVNDKVLALTGFFQKHYNENSFDLSEGLDVIKEFVANFGMRFEDTEQGLYCHVLDI